MLDTNGWESRDLMERLWISIRYLVPFLVLWTWTCSLLHSFSIAAITNHHTFSGLKLPSHELMVLQAGSLTQCHWAKLKVRSGLCSFPEALGGHVSLPFQLQEAAHSHSLAHRPFHLPNQQRQVEPFLYSSPLTSSVVTCLSPLPLPLLRTP